MDIYKKTALILECIYPRSKLRLVKMEQDLKLEHQKSLSSPPRLLAQCTRQKLSLQQIAQCVFCEVHSASFELQNDIIFIDAEGKCERETFVDDDSIGEIKISDKQLAYA